jgi:WD40 repeat protein
MRKRPILDLKFWILDCRLRFLFCPALLLIAAPARCQNVFVSNANKEVEQNTQSKTQNPRSQIDTPHLILQQGHSGPITVTAFAPGKSLLATASLDGTARLWDVKSGQLLAVCAHGAPISRLVFARDGQTFVTYGNGVARFWNASTGQMIAKTTLAATRNAINNTAFACDGNVVSTFVYSGKAQVWDMRTGAVRNTYDWQGDSIRRYGRPLTFTPDGKAVLFQREEQEDADPNGEPKRRYKIVTFELADTQTGQSKIILQPFEQRAEQGYNPVILFSPDGALMAQGGEDGSARLWNLRAGKLLPILRGSKLPVQRLAFSPDSKRLATAGSQATQQIVGDVAIWDTTTGKRLTTLPGKPDVAVRALCFARSGQTLAVAAPNPADRKSGLQLWDVGTGKVRAQIAMSGEPDSLLFSPDDALLIAGDADGALRAWNPQTGQTLATFAPARQLTHPTYSPDGTRIAAVATNGYLQLWDANTGHLLDCFATNTDFKPDARSLDTEPVFAPDGQAIAYVVSHKGAVEIYDLKTRQRRQIYTPDKNPATNSNNSMAWAERVVFSPDGKTLAFCANDGKTRFVDIVTGNALAAFDYSFSGFALNNNGEQGAQFTPDGKSFLALRESNINIYDVPSGQVRATISPGRFQDGIRMTRDGALVAAMLDREVQIYEVETGMLKSAVKVTDGEYLFSAMISPNGGKVLTRGSQRLRVWDTVTGEAVCTLETTAPSSEILYPFYGFAPISMGFSESGKYVGVRLPSRQMVVWDAESGKQINLPTPEVMADFAPLLRRPLGVVGASLIVHDPRTGSPLALLTSFPALTFAEQQSLLDKPESAESKALIARPFAWLAQASGGYYDGSPGITAFLRWNSGGALSEADRYASVYNLPAQVQKTLRLELPPDAKLGRE